jgi:hypothetical protein
MLNLSSNNVHPVGVVMTCMTFGHRGRFTSTSLVRGSICERHEIGNFRGQKLPG